MVRPLAPVLSGALCALATAAQDASADDWPSWRGPDSTGSSTSATPPTRWSETENVRWKVRLPGAGSSTPIVFGDRIYVTTAVETDSKPSEDAPRNVHEFRVLALDRADGSVVWERTVAAAMPHEAGHRTNTLASASPVTDGTHVWAFFGSRGLFCLDLEGEVQWSREFGAMRTRREFGEGASPALFGDALVVPWDHEGDDFVALLDKRTGEERWRTARDEPSAWTTPLVTEIDGEAQAILTGTNASVGYDLKSGEELWSLAGMTKNCIPTPFAVDGLVFLMSGFRGSKLQALDLAGAKGDLEDTPHVVWSVGQATSYVPSALYYEGLLYYVRQNSGVLECRDAKTGEEHYGGARLGEIRSVYASPVGAGGHVYVTARSGLTAVVQAGPEFAVVSENKLDDTIDASPVPVGDALLLRGWENLYCIGSDGE